MKAEIKGLLAGLAIAVMATGAWLYVRERINAPNAPADRVAGEVGTTSARTAEKPSPEPPPEPKFFVRNLLYGNFEVQPGAMVYWNFTVPGRTKDVTIAGTFHAFGGSGNDIQLVITDPFNFENWKNGHATSVLYDSGKVTNGLVRLSGVEAGQYVIALDNRFSALSRKQVTTAISITGYALP
jgi:hypothetical protein